MRFFLVAVALTVAVPAHPAAAGPSGSSARFKSSSSTDRLTAVRVHRGDGGGRHDRDGDFGRERDRQVQGDVFFPYREYQGDSLWRQDSFNDWWHDRPDRAYPAWVMRNATCERMWWSGGGWHC